MTLNNAYYVLTIRSWPRQQNQETSQTALQLQPAHEQHLLNTLLPLIALASTLSMSGSVPVANSLADIYPNTALASEGPRWNSLLAAFEAAYGHKASFIARSPGRVNILGEHIDYSLYSVLPMAITADAVMAVAATPTPEGASTFKVNISNLEDAKFPGKNFEVALNGEVEIDATKLEWTNYFRSGLRGALELLRKKHRDGFRPCSMDIMVDGTVPVGGGLSSSAAVVSASALAVMKANGEKAVDKKELTELAIVSERAVGVNSGGYG